MLRDSFHALEFYFNFCHDFFQFHVIYVNVSINYDFNVEVVVWLIARTSVRANAQFIILMFVAI